MEDMVAVGRAEESRLGGGHYERREAHLRLLCLGTVSWDN
jgi:hypothetical protein